MPFPKYLIFRVMEFLVKNTTESGEVTDSYSDELPFVELLSKQLGFSYKIFSTRALADGDFLLGNSALAYTQFDYSTYPVGSLEYTFAVKKTNYLSKSLVPLRPFTMPVWIMLLLCVVLMTFANFLMFRRRVSLFSALFYASVALLGKHRDWKPKSNAQKLLVLTWSVGLTFLTLAYGAVISSFLTVPGRGKEITTVEELYEAINKGKATALMFAGSTIDDDLIYKDSEMLNFIGKHVKEQNTVSVGEGGNFLEVIKPNVAVIGFRTQLEIYYGGNEHFISTDNLSVYMRIMTCYKFFGFCCIDQVDAAIHRIWGVGLVNKIYKDHAFKYYSSSRSKLPNMHSHDENTFMALNLSDMSAAFRILITGHILGFICLLYEIVIHSYFHQI